MSLITIIINNNNNNNNTNNRNNPNTHFKISVCLQAQKKTEKKKIKTTKLRGYHDKFTEEMVAKKLSKLS